MLTLYIKINGPLVLESHILEEEKKPRINQTYVYHIKYIISYCVIQLWYS